MKKENGEKKIEKVTVLNLEVLEKCERIKVEKYFLASPPNISRVAQRKRAGPITQRSMDRNHPLLRWGSFPPEESLLRKFATVYLL